MTRLDRQNALVTALEEIGYRRGSGSAAPRCPGLPEPAQGWVFAAYRELGGIQREPRLQPGAWDIPTTEGLIVELDEEQHFNRYRSAVLNLTWAEDLPWKDDYLGYSAEFEGSALRSHSGGGFWQSDGSVAQLGSAGPRGDLAGDGSPRWKQRALYDAMRDAVAAAGLIRLARVSVYDTLEGVQLGDALQGHAPLDLTALAGLIAQRTSSRQSPAKVATTATPNDHEREQATIVANGAAPAAQTSHPGVTQPATAPAVEPSDSRDRATYEPVGLARELGYKDEARPGKVVRDYLRSKHPDHPKHKRWVLDEEQAADVRANVPRKS